MKRRLATVDYGPVLMTII